MKSKFVLGKESDSKWGGVCSGLATAFDVDVFYFRAGFVILSLLGGPGLLLYGVCYLLMEHPEK